jgi:hypothetical protein
LLSQAPSDPLHRQLRPDPIQNTDGVGRDVALVSYSPRVR